MALDDTVKGASANAYADDTYATAYFAERPHSSDWAGTTKDACLIWSTTIIDLVVDYTGTKTTTTQNLRMPRINMPTQDSAFYDKDILPVVFKQAVCELALVLLRADRSKEPAVLGLGLDRVKADVIDIKINPKQVLALIPDLVLMMLQEFGDLRPEMARYVTNATSTVAWLSRV
tara:strand:- start:80 stop:604 length:525 start_codon:yes stop_codon:yes gene_type:complete